MKTVTRSMLIFSCIFSFPALSQELPPPPPPASNEIIVSPDKIFKTVETEASFPGGDAKWRAYLEKTIKSEIPQDKYAPPGKYTVLVQFVVDREGNISDVEALTTHGFGMEEEVIRVIKSGPKWEPAEQGGRKVKAYRKQPVTFFIVREFELSTYRLKAGTENTVELKLDNIKAEDIQVTVSNGIIRSAGNKSYIIKPTRPGKLLFSVSATVKRKQLDFGKVMLAVE